jgi:phage host-nuclease inhibitor protein Gam
MLDFIKENIPVIVTFLSGAGAWGYERNKRKADLKKADTENNKSIMDLYQEALDDLKKRYDADLKELSEKYDAKFSEMEARYNRLKKSFEDYKKTHK